MQIETQRLQRFLCESPSKTQFQIGYSDQSQQKQTARWSTRRSEFLPITWDLLKAREKSRVHGVIGLAPHWLKNWRENFKPITKRRSRNRVVTLKSHLKTALFVRKKNVVTRVDNVIKEKVRGFTRRVVRTFLSTPLRKWVTLKHIGRSRSGKGSLNKKK